MPACPHCKAEIDVIGAKDIVEEIRRRGWTKFSPNYMTKLKQQQKFPQPWVRVSGKDGWVRDQLDEYWAGREAEFRIKAEGQYLSWLAGLDPEERKRAIEALQKRAEEN